MCASLSSIGGPSSRRPHQHDYFLCMARRHLIGTSGSIPKQSPERTFWNHPPADLIGHDYRRSANFCKAEHSSSTCCLTSFSPLPDISKLET